MENYHILDNRMHLRNIQERGDRTREKARRIGESAPPTRSPPMGTRGARYWTMFAAETRGKNAPHEEQWHSLARAALEPARCTPSTVS